MSYFQNYLKRINKDGSTPQEKITKETQRDYDAFIKSSPTRREVSINGENFICSIQSHRYRDLKNEKYLVTRHDNVFHEGDLVYINTINNLTQKYDEIWLILRHEPHAFNGDNRYIIVQCKHRVKWVRESGVVVETPCLIIGTADNRLRDNFRTWNKLITPQPNKYIEILMPDLPISKNTRILTGDEAWKLVDYDRRSIAGVNYTTFTETSINVFDDDEFTELADKDKIGVLKITSLEQPIHIKPLIQKELQFQVLKNGEKYNSPIEYEFNDTEMEIVDGKIIVYEEGIFSLKAFLKFFPEIYIDLTIDCTNNTNTTNPEIYGDEAIKVGKKKAYYVHHFVDGEEQETGSSLQLSPTNLASLEQDANNNLVYYLLANTNGKIGVVTLYSDTSIGRIYKEIKIIGPWG